MLDTCFPSSASSHCLCLFSSSTHWQLKDERAGQDNSVHIEPVSLFQTSCQCEEVLKILKEKGFSIFPLFCCFYSCEILAVPFGIWALQPVAKSPRARFRPRPQTGRALSSISPCSHGSRCRIVLLSSLSLTMRLEIRFDLTCQFSVCRCQILDVQVAHPNNHNSAFLSSPGATSAIFTLSVTIINSLP